MNTDAVSPQLDRGSPPEAVSLSRPVVEWPVRVLLIEDNTEHAEWIELLLSRQPPERFVVERVASLVQALIRLAQPDVDVILLDLGLPELEGFRSHTAIRRIAPKVPVVILTGDDRPVSRDVSLSGGAQYYLLKSEVSSEQLQHAVIQAYHAA